MSAAHEPEELDGPHEGPIKTPKQLILTVLFAFLVPIFAIVLLVMFVTADKRPAAGSSAMTPEAIAERIRPVGTVEIKDASDVASLKTGEQVFGAQCTACHATGALGAPKLGDAAAWGPRIKTGFDALLHSALAGKGQMPAQGGGDFSDLEIARAVVYMTGKAGGTFPEPAAPAATAAATPATAVATTATATTAATAAPAAQTAPVTPPATTTVAAAANNGSSSGPPALYSQICSACHATGVAGAPKVGDKAAWAPRAAQGVDALTASAIQGKGAMPPKGGSSASDADIKAVVTYMVGASK